MSSSWSAFSAVRQTMRKAKNQNQIISMRTSLEVLNSFDLIIKTSIMQSADEIVRQTDKHKRRRKKRPDSAGSAVDLPSGSGLPSFSMSRSICFFQSSSQAYQTQSEHRDSTCSQSEHRDSTCSDRVSTVTVRSVRVSTVTVRAVTECSDCTNPHCAHSHCCYSSVEEFSSIKTSNRVHQR